MRNYEEAVKLWRWYGNGRNNPQPLTQNTRDYVQAGEDGMNELIARRPEASRALLLAAAKYRAANWYRSAQANWKQHPERYVTKDATEHEGFAEIDWRDYLESIPPETRSLLEPDRKTRRTSNEARKVLAIARDFLDDPTYKRRTRA